jgi:hypothetical protein
VALATNVILSLLRQNAEHIRKHPGSHLSSIDSIDPSKYCPIRDEFPLECACQSRSPAFRWRPRPGASLILVPAGLIGSWEEEWAQLEPDGPKLKVGFYVHHSEYPTCWLLKGDRAQLRLQHAPRGVTTAPAKN